MSNVPTGENGEVSQSEGGLSVHIIDVGQGDGIFVELPDGTTLLIDAGEKQYGQTVIDYITARGYNRIDYLVGTHPHSDHIGGLEQVIRSFDIGTVYMPKKSHTTSTYLNLLQTIADKGLSIQTAKAGKTIAEGGDFSVDILSPVDEDYGDELNLYSVVIKITYGSQRFLFLGDAETENEEQMSDVQAEFVKVGHHGSATSSDSEFVRRVGAKYAVVSVGAGNSYGLPKDKILQRWQESGAAIYRTDESGSIVAYSDGSSITISAVPSALETVDTETNETVTSWVLNTSSKKIHRSDCASVTAMAESNCAQSNKTIEELIAEGYTACKSCQPDAA